MYGKHTSKCCVLRYKKKSSNWVSFFYHLLKLDQHDDLLQRPSLTPCLPSPHPLPCQQQPQWLQVFPLCIGGVFLGTEPCFLSAYQQPLYAPPTNLADMVMSLRTPQAVAAVTHSQPVRHACPPPPPPPLTFVSYWSSSALIIVLFLYSEQMFEILGISCQSCRKDGVVNALVFCHPHVCIALAPRRELRSTEIYVS